MDFWPLILLRIVLGVVGCAAGIYLMKKFWKGPK